MILSILFEIIIINCTLFRTVCFCCKQFEKHIGTTPNAYLIHYRLHQSTWYLKNADMTVTQIAHAVGFSGSSYYAEAFKKRYGKTPSEYKKSNL